MTTHTHILLYHKYLGRLLHRAAAEKEESEQDVDTASKE